MNPSTTTARRCLRAGLLFGGCLLGVVILPFAGFVFNSEALLFAPQYLFPYNGFVIRQASGSQAVFASSTALLLNVVQWGFAATGFTWFARHLSIRNGPLAAATTILVIGALVDLGFSLFGVTLELDGP